MDSLGFLKDCLGFFEGSHGYLGIFRDFQGFLGIFEDS